MDDWWSFWSRQEWYWSALSFFCIFLIVLLMMCLCWKFCNAIKDPDDEDHFILPRDPSPSLIILHAQTPSESERILRHYDSIRSQSFHHQQQQQQYQSTGPVCQTPCHYNSQFSTQPYDPGVSNLYNGANGGRPPPYAPNYYK